MPAVVVSASPSPAAILIRPDGYVAQVCDDLSDPALRSLLKRSAPMHDATQPAPR
jgi:hypothetical protein